MGVEEIVFTDDEVSQEAILKYFRYLHLPPALQAKSYPWAQKARWVLDNVPRCAERSAGLRKLLEAKDCFVRACVP